MRRISLAVLILALIAIDWLTFHDALKPEHYTSVQYLMGLVSVPLLLVLGKDLLKDS